MYIEILRVIIGSHNLLLPGCYMYMPDEVFHDWKSIRIKEEEDDGGRRSAVVSAEARI